MTNRRQSDALPTDDHLRTRTAASATDCLSSIKKLCNAEQPRDGDDTHHSRCSTKFTEQTNAKTNICSSSSDGVNRRHRTDTRGTDGRVGRAGGYAAGLHSSALPLVQRLRRAATADCCCRLECVDSGGRGCRVAASRRWTGSAFGTTVSEHPTIRYPTRSLAAEQPPTAWLSLWLCVCVGRARGCWTRRHPSEMLVYFRTRSRTRRVR